MSIEELKAEHAARMARVDQHFDSVMVEATRLLAQYHEAGLLPYRPRTSRIGDQERAP